MTVLGALATAARRRLNSRIKTGEIPVGDGGRDRDGHRGTIGSATGEAARRRPFGTFANGAVPKATRGVLAGACGPRQRSSVPVRCLPGKSAQAFRWHALDAELPVCRTGGTRREGRLSVRSARQARRTRTQQRPRRASTAIRARTRTRASSRALSVDPASSITTLIRAHLARIVPRDR